MYIIDIKSDSRYPIDRKRIRSVISDVLDKEKINQDVEVSVMVVGKRKMHTLNKNYRDLDYPTNVLSFCQLENKDENGFVYPTGTPLYLGDIVVCYPLAREQARESWLMVDDWIETLVCHSMEHLLGRHHK